MDPQMLLKETERAAGRGLPSMHSDLINFNGDLNTLKKVLSDTGLTFRK
jgi:hypothetical protein